MLSQNNVQRLNIIFVALLLGMYVLSPAAAHAASDESDYFQKGISSAESGNYEEAIKNFAKAIELNPKDAAAYYNRGNAYGKLGTYEEAIRDYDKAIELNPKNAEAYSNRGNAYVNLGNHQQAIKDFDKAIELNPKNAMAYSIRGAVYGELGNFQQAIKDFDKAIELNPKDASAYSARGAAFSLLGNSQQAIKDFDKAIELNPKNAIAYSSRGAAFLLLGNSQQATEDMRAAARLGYKPAQDFLTSQGTRFSEVLKIAEQGNPEAQYHVGMMYNNGIGVNRDPRKALEWFEKSARSGDPLANYKLGCYLGGQFHVVAVDLDKSLQYKLVAARAGYSIAQHDVGVAYFDRKQYEEALYWWELAAKQGFPMSLHSLSVVYKEGKAGPKDSVRAYAYFKLAKLLSEKQISEKAQLALDEVKKIMSPAELERAEQMVSQWKSDPTPLTIKASAGTKEADKFLNSAGK